MNNLQTLWSNPHLRYPLIAAGLLKIAVVWFPAYKEQLEETVQLIMYYTIAAAANSAPTNKQEKKEN